MPIRVLIIDDSSLMRSLLKELVNSLPNTEVVGTAPDPIVAREMIKQLNPDVLTLDVEMPRMDGLDFLERLMRLRPMPVVMVSSLTERGNDITMRALELGAIDFVTKPRLGIREGIMSYQQELGDKLSAAYLARGRIKALPPVTAAAGAGLRPLNNARVSSEKLIAIGASTGGTEAIKEFLMQLPPDAPGVLITQHMPPGFTASFAKRMDGLCRISVFEAQGGERIMPGQAYIAPGHAHLVLERSGANYITQIHQGEPRHRHRPSVDVLFESVADKAGANAVGVILTGMGKDGAQGLLQMRKAGAQTYAQDEASCVVYGMPREAVSIGAADQTGRPDQLAGQVLTYLTTTAGRLVRV